MVPLALQPRPAIRSGPHVYLAPRTQYVENPSATSQMI